MQFAASLSLLWPELPFLDRFAAAARAGFTAVEILFPYDAPAKVLQQTLVRNGLHLVLINAPPPNYTGGPRGFAAVPGGEARFTHDMRRAYRYTEMLRVRILNVMAGQASGQEARETLIANLKQAAATAPTGLTLTIEPHSTLAMPGSFLNDYDLAAEILAEVGADNVGLQFDSFHAQMIHGDAVAVFEKHRALIRHIQLADTPDRAPPGSGEIDFKKLMKTVKSSGYAGYVSGEYHPVAKTEATLGWASFS